MDYTDGFLLHELSLVVSLMAYQTHKITIKYDSVVEWARLSNQNQPNSPKTEKNPTPAGSWSKLKQTLTAFTQYSNGLFFFAPSNLSGSSLSLVAVSQHCHKIERGPQSVPTAITTQYFLRELKERAVIDVQDDSTHTHSNTHTQSG